MSNDGDSFDFDMKLMTKALKSPRYAIRHSSDNTGTDRILYQMNNHGSIEIPLVPYVHMISGFIPHLLSWYRQCETKDHKHLMSYVMEYYDGIPEFLEKELSLVSDTEELRIKYFPYIYHLVLIHQTKEFNKESI